MSTHNQFYVPKGELSREVAELLKGKGCALRYRGDQIIAIEDSVRPVTHLGDFRSRRRDDEARRLR